MVARASAARRPSSVMLWRSRATNMPSEIITMLTGVLSCARFLSSASSACSVARARRAGFEQHRARVGFELVPAGLEVGAGHPAHSRSTAFWNVPGSLFSSAHASLMLMRDHPDPLARRAGDAHQRVGDALAIGGELDAADAGRAGAPGRPGRRARADRTASARCAGCCGTRRRAGCLRRRRTAAAARWSSLSFDVTPTSRGVAGVTLAGRRRDELHRRDRARLAVDLELEVGGRQRRHRLGVAIDDVDVDEHDLGLGLERRPRQLRRLRRWRLLRREQRSSTPNHDSSE